MISTVFTHLQLLDTAKCSKNDTTEAPSSEKDHFSQFSPLIYHLTEKKILNRKKLNAFESLLTLETILKLSICAICQSCGSSVSKDKVCSFVGCHVPIPERTITLRCSAIFLMEDETNSACIHINDLAVCRSFLFMLSDEEWNLLLKTATHKGELLFLKSKNEMSGYDPKDVYSVTATCFNIFCEVHIMSNFLQYQCKLRPFSDKQFVPQTIWNDNMLNFICLTAKPISAVKGDII